MDQFKDIAAAFQCSGVYLGEVPYGSGHINDTYKVSYAVDGREVHYIHQRVNKNIFKNVPGLMENIGQVTRHQRKKLAEAGADQIDRRVLTLIQTKEGKDYFVDANGDYWRTYVFIENAVGIDVVESTEQAYEAAKAFGEFQCQLTDLPGRLHETIPGFHHTRSRFNVLKAAIATDIHGRVADVKAEIEFAMAREAMVDVVIDLRPDSSSCGKWVGVELSADNRRMIYIPAGVAHGFQTLENDTELFYQMSEPYVPGLARGVRWNDPAFGIAWPVVNPVMSDRDRAFEDFKL